MLDVYYNLKIVTLTVENKQKLSFIRINPFKVLQLKIKIWKLRPVI